MKKVNFLSYIFVILFVSVKVYSQAAWPYNVQFGSPNSYNLRTASLALGNQYPPVYNTAVGDYSLSNGTSSTPVGALTGAFNNGFGGWTLMYNTSGSDNNAFGYRALNNTTSGSGNIAIGSDALFTNSTGGNNIALGYQALFYNNCITGKGGNIAIGFNAGKYNSSGFNNVFIGTEAGRDETGSNKFYLGNGAINTLIYGEFDVKNIRLNANYDANSRVTIVSGASNSYLNGTSGLRFANLNNTTNSITNPTGKVLSVNAAGDVILVNDLMSTNGGVSQNCSTANFVPVNSSTVGLLQCSQIYDNGTGVGIGFSTATAANSAFPSTSLTGAWFSTSSTDFSSYTNFKLAVNGIARAHGYFATSDEKFKKDIQPIKDPLSVINKLEGKAYLWNQEAYKDKGFDGGLHTGFIAQELEKVLPHLVSTNDLGEKSVNYIELLPFLVEALKEQQKQIEELKSQINTDFKHQNVDLLELQNTKIINVSPNPSSDFITISFNVEKNVQNASIVVYDLNGKQMSNLLINERNLNMTRTLQKDNFGKGIYIVSLIVNGKSIDSKKIIFE